MNSFIENKTTCSTHIVATTFGVLVGLAGINHGLFEILQGNVKPEGFFISAIGPSQRFWEYGYETALTIVPNIIVTGILAVAFGILVTIWSILYIDRRFGPGILLVLSITDMSQPGARRRARIAADMPAALPPIITNDLVDSKGIVQQGGCISQFGFNRFHFSSQSLGFIPPVVNGNDRIDARYTFLEWNLMHHFNCF